MAMARPVVGNEHPEQSQIIAQSEAGRCVPWDENAFAAAIVDLLENPEKAKAMGLKGRRWVAENRTNSKMADVVEERYRSILDQAGREGRRRTATRGGN
jgi:glycosyltransferase involved in cell wall biosynthesis